MSTDLLPITLDEMIAEAERETAMRRRVYPGWVTSKRLTPEKAARQIAVMEAIAARLRAQPENHAPSLAGKVPLVLYFAREQDAREFSDLCRSVFRSSIETKLP